MESLIAQEVDAITSGWMYAEQAALDAVAPYGCPYLNAFTSEFVAEQVREQQTEYGSIFQVCATEATYGLGFIRTLDELTATGVVGAAQPPHHVHRGAGAVGAHRHPRHDCPGRAVGLEVADLIVIPSPVVNWEGVIARIHASDPAAVMLAHWLPEDTARFQRQFVANPTDALLYSIYSPSVPAYLARGGAGGRGAAVVDGDRLVRRHDRPRVRRSIRGRLWPHAGPLARGHRLRRDPFAGRRVGAGREPAAVHGGVERARRACPTAA